MNKKKKRKRLLLPVGFLLLGIACLLLVVCQKKLQYERAKECMTETSIFSWEGTYTQPEQEEALLSVLEKLKCTVIYQDFGQMQEGEIQGFLERRAQKGQSVYALAGAAAYALEENAASMIKEIDKVAEINKQAPKAARVKGIVFDVEPYGLEEWDEEPERVMELYVANMKKAYAYARKKQLVVLVCIPHFYDKKGYTAQLEELIAEGCDAVAVMNYQKADEAGQIETEMRLTQQYHRALIHITELQRPGTWDLTSDNTYYEDGISAVWESWEKLQRSYPDTKLGFSYHYLEPAIEIME